MVFGAACRQYVPIFDVDVRYFLENCVGADGFVVTKMPLADNIY
jgi:hypothetical protein